MSIYNQYMYSYPHKLAYGKLENVNLSDYVKYLNGNDNTLYIHIPFCEGKCGYCNLFSLAGQKSDLVDTYSNSISNQAKQYKECFRENNIDVKFSDLVLGGGTPMYLSCENLQRIFDIAKDMGYIGQNAVVETSPRQTTMDKLRILKNNNVKRISIGVQSFNESELTTLNRIHTPDHIRTAMEAILKTGFDCVNMDIIYGIPNQTMESLKYSIDEALKYNPDELFVYPLYIKKDTYLYNKNARVNPMAEEMYRFIRPYLIERGYIGLSMRRFVKKEKAISCINQSKSCGFDTTLSLGCGGRSYLGNLHFCNPYKVKQSECKDELMKFISTKDYCKINHGYILDDDEQKRRFVIKNILFATGINLDEYKKRFNGNLISDFPIINEWITKGYVKYVKNIIKITEEGVIHSDEIGPLLMSEEVKCKMYK